MPFRNFPGNGQTQAASGFIIFAPGLVEPVEDMQQIFPLDTGAMIRNGQTPVGQLNFHAAVFRAELHRIVQEDHQHLVQPPEIAGHLIHGRIQFAL